MIVQRIRIGMLLLASAACLLAAGMASAQAATHEVVWGHANPSDVARFVIYVSSVEGDLSSARQIDVGKPNSAPGLGSLTSFSAVIQADSDDYVAIGAVGNDGATSPPSDWALLPPSKPGQPLLLP